MAGRSIVAPVSDSSSWPIGATLVEGGVNFSVYSKHSTELQLLLFDHVDDERPTLVVPLDPAKHRSYHYWHVFVPGLKAGQVYAYRAHGPFVPAQGLALRSRQGAARSLRPRLAVPRRYDRMAAHRRRGQRRAIAMKSVVVDPTAYDWEGDEPLQPAIRATVIYEMHVARFHPPSQLRGRRRKARHLCRSDREDSRTCSTWASPRSSCCRCSSSTPTSPPVGMNYWGYPPVSFFAPHRRTARARIRWGRSTSSATW